MCLGLGITIYGRHCRLFISGFTVDQNTVSRYDADGVRCSLLPLVVHTLLTDVKIGYSLYFNHVFLLIGIALDGKDRINGSVWFIDSTLNAI